MVTNQRKVPPQVRRLEEDPRPKADVPPTAEETPIDGIPAATALSWRDKEALRDRQKSFQPTTNPPPGCKMNEDPSSGRGRNLPATRIPMTGDTATEVEAVDAEMSPDREPKRKLDPRLMVSRRVCPRLR